MDTHAHLQELYVSPPSLFLVQGEAQEQGVQGHGNYRTPEGR